jgi:hypothetical protein
MVADGFTRERASARKAMTKYLRFGVRPPLAARALNAASAPVAQARPCAGGVKMRASRALTDGKTFGGKLGG